MTTDMSKGLEVDLGPLHLAIGTLTSSVDELRKRLETLQVDLAIAGQATCPTPTATFSIDMGHPPSGKWWQVRNLIVGGSNITQTPSGTAYVVTMGSDPGPNPPLFACRDFTAGTFPQKAFYSTHELVLEEQEHLWITILNGTAGTNYAAAGMVEVFPQFIRGRL